MWSLFILFMVHLLWSSCDALKIFEGSLSAPYKLFFHRTADFGKFVGTYNVSGPLMVATQDTHTAHLSGCDISEYIVNTSDTEVIYDQIYANSVVMVLRGNCTFSQKVYNAQLLGAIGVIVGDKNGSNDEWIVMSKEHDGNSISIPAVFVQHNTYQCIYRLIQFTSGLQEAYNGQICGFEPTAHDVIWTVLDANGEYVAPTNTMWLIAFGIVIVVIPTLWCFIVCMALLRKRIMLSLYISMCSRNMCSV